MSSITEQEAREKRPRTKKDFIYWEGGVKFGGLLALITAMGDLVLHPERYLPLWPPTRVVWFSWLWMLTVHLIIFFAAGCLFGLIIWAMFGQRLQSKLEE